MTDVADLWRCASCGKWSHAKRNPRTHERFVANGSDQEHPERSALEIAADLELLGPDDDESGLTRVEEPSWNGDPDEDGNPGGAWLRCGPFETWKATRVP